MGRGLAHVRRNAIAYLALFVALGSTGAWASARIGSDDIKRNAVRSKHVKAGQIKASDTDLAKVREVRGEQQVPANGGISDPALTIRAKRGDLILIQASVSGRRVSGSGDCHVNLLEDGPGAGGSQNVPVISFEEFFDPGDFKPAFLAEDTIGTTVHNEAIPRSLPITVPGAYELNLVLRAGSATTCAYRDRVLYASVVR